MQESEVIGTPQPTELVTETATAPEKVESVTAEPVDPIYRHKDGRIITKQQLLNDGLDEARIKDGELLEPSVFEADFDTLLLDNSGEKAESAPSFEDCMDYDDEIGFEGNIDVGEIASQYLSLEIC